MEKDLFIFMEYIILFIIAIFLIFYVKSILFWLYLWQLKEYRLDRFWAEYGDGRRLLRFWFGAGGRKFRRPVWTKKAILIFIFSFLSVAIPAFTMRFPDLTIRFNLLFPFFYFALYLAIPAVAAFWVILFKIPTYFVRQAICKRAAQKIKKMKKMLVIGITGSYGKTSTKEFLAQILSQKFKVAKTPANVNSEIGVAKYVLEELPTDAEIFIVEMGAYRPGEIKRLCKIVRPKIGILTGISEQHLGLFGSMENIKKAKFELIESLPKSGFAFFNGENKYALELAQKWNGPGAIYRGNILQLYKKIPRHYELNLNAAVDVAKYLGMTREEIEAALKNIDLAGNMIKSFSGKNNALVIDDTYSANPDGVLAALDYLGSQIKGQRIVIMPCLIELGSASAEIHEKIGRKIKEICSLGIITAPDCFSYIKKGGGERVVQESEPQKIREVLDKKISNDAAILLEGHLPEEIIKIVKE